jgi:hypothetical protein
MYGAFLRSDYYGSSAPPLGQQSATDLPTTGLAARREGDPWMVIAVGTALTGGPPHRSQRALLTHWALALGPNAKAHIWKGMHHAGGW